MPTILIETESLEPAQRRRIAVQLTRWLSDRDIRSDRVVVRFAVADLDLAFSGGLPVSAMRDPAAARAAAWVTCCVSPDRDEEFRSGLARRITEVLQVTTSTALCYIEFRPTDPDLVHIAARGPLRRASAPADHDQAAEGEER
ncbi:hypothetical protein [Myceligenerans xiligouense]|uniref:Tautomerase-like protein n=1 Tax=Myceligenerans xiligouense TaxID=253184 RepID=A0A3N4ZIN4_9MICO|nr:hypothetical protein [Myceligenerans xiligouense]RPF20745.1 hypothetical protein EDD34_1349 [Myceligenerans xiligouense]